MQKMNTTVRTAVQESKILQSSLHQHYTTHKWQRTEEQNCSDAREKRCCKYRHEHWQFEVGGQRAEQDLQTPATQIHLPARKQQQSHQCTSLYPIPSVSHSVKTCINHITKIQIQQRNFGKGSEHVNNLA